jgi:hypothetical protein
MGSAMSSPHLMPLPDSFYAALGDNSDCHAALIAAVRAYGEACAAAEREAWGDALSDALQSDLENGVKWLNERAAVEFLTKYPALSAAIRARGEA